MQCPHCKSDQKSAKWCVRRGHAIGPMVELLESPCKECDHPWHSTPAALLDPELEARESERCRIEGCEPPCFTSTPAAPETPPDQDSFTINAFIVFNSGFAQFMAADKPKAEEWVRHHLADSPEVEIREITLAPVSANLRAGTPRKEE